MEKMIRSDYEYAQFMGVFVTILLFLFANNRNIVIFAKEGLI